MCLECLGRARRWLHEDASSGASTGKTVLTLLIYRDVLDWRLHSEVDLPWNRLLRVSCNLGRRTGATDKLHPG